jgi:hypothetical protein
VIRLIGDWLGIELDSALPIGAHRRLLRHAKQISQSRGTLPGIRLVLELSFRGMQLEVLDGGLATWSRDPEWKPPPGEQTLKVICPPRVHPDDVAAIRRVVEEVKPAHVGFELLDYEQEPL